MLLYSVYNKEVIASPLCNTRLTKDEAIELIGGEIINSENMDDENVIIDEKKYFYEDIIYCDEDELLDILNTQDSDEDELPDITEML